MTERKLSYDDLMLGEKAKEAFLSGKSMDWISKNCPTYLNTRPVFHGLNTTDLVIAGVLSGMKQLIIGDTGTGKTQLARDIGNAYFGGDKSHGGETVTIEGVPDLDLYSDILTYVDLAKGKRVLNGNEAALYWNLEEFNRCPEIAQNQFYAVGNGRLIYQGNSIPIGRDGFVSAVATANYGNGEFKGTFETDKALLNRWGVIVDFDNELFKPDETDRMLIKRLRAANPDIKESPKADLTKKIIQATKEISTTSQDPGLEALAVADYLEFGLDNCRGRTNSERPSSKGKVWPVNCQDCPRNLDQNYLCSLVKSPQTRTIQATIRYAAALHYLAKIKNPDLEINPVDLMFNAFELTAAYQHLLNPAVLRTKYLDQNPRMMREVIDRLKSDFRGNEDFIITSLEHAKKGEELDYFDYHGKKSLGYDSLSDEEKKEVTKFEPPFNDNRGIGLSWMKKAVDLERQIHERRKAVDLERQIHERRKAEGGNK